MIQFQSSPIIIEREIFWRKVDKSSINCFLDLNSTGI